MKILSFDFKGSTFARSLRIFSPADRKKFLYVAILQTLLSLLDLLGVAIIGLFGALAVSGISSREPGTKVNAALQIFHIQGFSFQAQAAILGLSAGIVLVGKTLISIYFTRRTLFFLSRRAAMISIELTSKFFYESILRVQQKTSQESIYALTTGVNSIALGLIGTSILLVSDVSLTLILGMGLFIVEPSIALVALILFGSLAYLLYNLMSVRAKELGSINWEMLVQGNGMILESLGTYRELVVRNQRGYFLGRFAANRYKLAEVAAEIQFMPSIGKYVIETSIIISALIISGFQFMLNGASHAVATLAVFLAASTRIAPAALRIQQGSLQIRNNVGMAEPTISLIEELQNSKLPALENWDFDLVYDGFKSNVLVENLSLTYPGESNPALHNIGLEISEGTMVAIVGPSGAGKTSLVDVILGIISPSQGVIKLSGISPLEAISKWPGAIAYVPQEIVIAADTIRNNVAFGYSKENTEESLVDDAISIARLEDFVNGLPRGLDTEVGEYGSNLSGGQRQRLGIARALYTKPKLLILDEATSSLDAETESKISQSLMSLKGQTTLLVIAHRLSTVQNADLVIYIENGEILSRGTFAEVRAAVKDFDLQARLLGL